MPSKQAVSETVPGGRPAGAPLGNMVGRMDDVRRACTAFSEEHRAAIPTDVIQARLQGIVETVGEVFRDRVMQICFLLDHHRVLRFNELMKVMPPMSTRTLSAKLTILQEHGLVTRIMFDETPPRVEYRLTARGKSLVDMLFPAIVHVTWSRPEEGA